MRLPRLISIAEFSKETSIPKSTIYAMIARGEIPSIRYGEGRGSIRIHEDDARAWIEASRHERIP